MSVKQIADQVRSALEARDLTLLEPLLDPDVRWGAGPTPRACRSKIAVIRTLSRLLDTGLDAKVAGVTTRRGGLVVHLQLSRPEATEERFEVWQSFRISSGLIVEIAGHDDQAAADLALG